MGALEIFKTDNLGLDYWLLLDLIVRRCGADASPRGQLVKEVNPLVFELSDPLKCVVSRPGFSEKLMLLEIASVLSGTYDQALYDLVSPQAAALLSAAGAYGPRTRDQLPYVIEELERDPSSRRAEVYVGRETDLRYSAHFEMPCTVSWQFFVRDGRLDMVVNMRSWDLVWGLGYDLPVFVAVQDCLASALGYAIGRFTCVAGSGHVYERHFDLKVRQESLTLPSFTHGGDGTALVEWRETATDARQALEAFRQVLAGQRPVSVSVAWSRALEVWTHKSLG